MALEGDEKTNILTEKIIAAAMTVHTELGPGLLESAYQVCLAAELKHQGVAFRREVPLAIQYRDEQLECGYRLDFVVNEDVIVEVKSIERLERIHHAQLLSYLRLSDKRVGLLINFNVQSLKNGIKRVMN